MKIEDIVIAAGSIQKLIDQDVPLCTAWALKKLLDRCNPVLEFYGQEDLQNLLEALMKMGK